MTRPAPSAVVSALLLALLVLAPAGRAHATNYVVDSFADESSSTPPNGNCTLREALIAVNEGVAVDACPAPAGDNHGIRLAAGTYALTLTGAGEDAGATGDLDILEDVVLLGAGMGQTVIDASALGDRALHVGSHARFVRLLSLSVRGGRVVGAAGEDVRGGGILNEGGLTLQNVAIVDNEARGGDGDDTITAGDASGGGIHGTEGSQLSMYATVVQNNRAIGGDDVEIGIDDIAHGGVGSDGGVRAVNALRIESSVFSGNLARGGSSAGASPPGVAGGARAGGLGHYRGQLTILNTAFIGNAAIAGSGASGGDAGAGAAWITAGNGGIWETLFEGNLAQGGDSAHDGDGGPAKAGALRAGGTLGLGNSTFSGNQAIGGIGSPFAAARGGDAQGGALVFEGRALTLYSMTFEGNRVQAGAGTTTSGPGFAAGGAIDGPIGDLEAVNTIVAGSEVSVPGVSTTGEGCSSPLATLGGNVESPASSCGFTAASDQAPVSALALALQPLADNGGPTRTHALAEGSLAIGAAVEAECTDTDQRGFTRLDGDCDSGAFELGAALCTDADEDGYAVEGGACGPIDCDDGDDEVNPGATEIPANGIDDDCDPTTPTGCGQEQAIADAGVAASGARLPLATLLAALAVATLRTGARRRIPRGC